MKCPNCEAENAPDSNFCEECGSSMTTPAPEAAAVQSHSGATKSGDSSRCGNCGAGPEFVDKDGFCDKCGVVRVRPARDHFEVALSAKTAGVSDVGKKHHQNEDFLAMAAEQNALALVVCDGVSTSQHPQQASQLASENAIASLTAALKTGVNDAQAALKDAIAAAQNAVCKIIFNKPMCEEDSSPPCCTIVLALVQARKVTIAWVGDSRAYWIGSQGARQLTKDHSWVNAVVAAGRMSLEEALKDKRAHSITNSLGAEDDGTNPGVTASFVTLNISEPGRLLICSDGLWNYAESQKLDELLAGMPRDVDALTLARNLVNFARDQGGKDNITVVAANLS